MADSIRIDQLVGDHAARLSERLLAHRAQLFPPHATKAMRSFSSGEVADLLGVKDAYLRRLSLDGRRPQPDTGRAGRRMYSTSDIMALRKLLESGAKVPGTYLPGRRAGDGVQVITVINFKGGSGTESKTPRSTPRSANAASKPGPLASIGNMTSSCATNCNFGSEDARFRSV